MAVLNNLNPNQEFDAMWSEKQKNYKHKPQQNQTITCKYCRSSYSAQRCSAYGNSCRKFDEMNHFRAVCRSTRCRAVHKVELDKYREEDGQIYMVNINCINSNARGPGIIAKLKLISYQNSVKISYKEDTGSESNI